MPEYLEKLNQIDSATILLQTSLSAVVAEFEDIDDLKKAQAIACRLAGIYSAVCSSLSQSIAQLEEP